MFTREFILSMKSKALRRGVWFNALDHVERGILSLTARVVKKVVSVKLGVILVRILSKLRDAMNGEFIKRVELGMMLARRIATQAVAWGYHEAETWASDNDFIRYLTLGV